MNMQSRNQYLKELRSEYLKTKPKKGRSGLLDEAEKRTGLNRRYLMEKLKPKSNLDKDKAQRKKRKQFYDNSVKPALVQMWRIFDYPCGQRLEPLLKSETDKLRLLDELDCSDKTAAKLKTIGSATIDRKLKHQKEIERIKRKYRRKMHPLLYQKIPVKVFGEQNRRELGNIQIDLVEHCGGSAAGEFLNTLSSTDISSGWWEGEIVMGKAQERTFLGIQGTRARYPFPWKEIHSDNGSEFINAHLFRYTEKEGLDFSRSRPYKKNDNCLVEQKNWTHVKKFIGYVRYDTESELRILNDLYRNELRLFKNFFQPVIKLVSKERVGGRIHRRYDQTRTPYQRAMESKEVSENKRQELKKIYLSLNPAQLKRDIDVKLGTLYMTYQQKNKILKVDINKKISVRFFNAHQNLISVR
ncbi:MAG: transposase [Candidatus Portnoybacteria bacterium CG_4_10_14_0_2_um_filter_44_20]|uniref:Integrase n=3 Tax=Candidatus Portnoyibacteriota TaxID=1817913 RepID=A0A2H0KP89_9BACT|nr:MAG: integrase [Candidatus Portnoybacteria bacterium CG11_big_fil_rev_8_21_14_0_20_44_10]PIZ69830.1 MAG: transposase [Candidatus Portnoybacteria bacterium CG_4_10_14_0_2_um_filter_44_20]